MTLLIQFHLINILNFNESNEAMKIYEYTFLDLVTLKKKNETKRTSCRPHSFFQKHKNKHD